ncbi:MAG: TraX protein [Ruminococcus sp.]|nr:TraX protein [Ruminococcus sp.]
MEENKRKILSGSALKCIALITMITDHIAAHILINMKDMTDALIVVAGYKISVYLIMRIIGRLAFPIYCFLLTEGFIHTHDRTKYGINLFFFALVSEIPWDLEHKGQCFYIKSQNVFFTLFLGYLALCIYEKYKDSHKELTISIMTIFFISMFLKADYGTFGVAFILIMYFLRDNKIIRAVVGSSILSLPFAVIFSFWLINMYSGERGFIKGKIAKYAFYAIYPVHIFIIYLIKKELLS